MGRPAIDETGKRYGRWTVIERAGNEPCSGNAAWRCRCDCGTEKVVSGASLRIGQTTSCGCYRSELRRQRSDARAVQTAANRALYRVKRAALRRDIPWELTKEQVLEIIQQPCHYCGKEPDRITEAYLGNGEFAHLGIDRVDNDRGYVIDNVVPCCKQCNVAKNNYPLAEFRDWICRVHEHWAVRR